MEPPDVVREPWNNQESNVYPRKENGSLWRSGYFFEFIFNLSKPTGKPSWRCWDTVDVLRFGAGFFLSQKLKMAKENSLARSSPLSVPIVLSLIGYDLRWDLFQGKRQSDDHSRNRPFFKMTHLTWVRVSFISTFFLNHRNRKNELLISSWNGKWYRWVA